MSAWILLIMWRRQHSYNRTYAHNTKQSPLFPLAQRLNGHFLNLIYVVGRPHTKQTCDNKTQSDLITVHRKQTRPALLVSPTKILYLDMKRKLASLCLSHRNGAERARDKKWKLYKALRLECRMRNSEAVECKQIADIERNAFLNNCLCVTVRAKFYRNYSYSFEMINYYAPMIIRKCIYIYDTIRKCIIYIPNIDKLVNSKQILWTWHWNRGLFTENVSNLPWLGWNWWREKGAKILQLPFSQVWNVEMLNPQLFGLLKSDIDLLEAAGGEESATSRTRASQRNANDFWSNHCANGSRSKAELNCLSQDGFYRNKPHTLTVRLFFCPSISPRTRKLLQHFHWA